MEYNGHGGSGGWRMEEGGVEIRLWMSRVEEREEEEEGGERMRGRMAEPFYRLPK